MSLHLVPSPVALSKSHLFRLVQFSKNRTRQEILRSLLNHARYDTPGNLKTIGGQSFEYDAENRQTSASINGITTSYRYDGNGRRVQTAQGAVATNFVYDINGNMAAQYGVQPAAAVCTTCYVSFDHLGSTRMMTDSQGQVVARHDYLPFGEEIVGVGGRTAPWGASDTASQKFTGKERDAETGLDYFGARYFSGMQGRFTSPDEPLLDQSPDEPRSWNIYGYGRNNPLRFTDPTGTTTCDANGNNCHDSITVTDKASGISTIDVLLLRPLVAVMQPAIQIPQQLLNWMGQPRNGTCLASSTAAGGSIGAGVGLLGLAGGPAVGISEPTAVAMGGGAGWLAGMVSCMTGSGETGGGDGQSIEGNQPPLKKLHKDSTLSKTSLDFWRKKSTQEIVDSLRPGTPEGLRVKADGTIMNGNTRITILQERGVDVNSLPRELH